MKTTPRVIIGLLLCATLVGLAMIARNIGNQQSLQAEQLRDSLNTQANISLIVHHLGYTGFIHNFKNYVLRGDLSYYESALENLRRLDDLFFNNRSRYQDKHLHELIGLLETVIKEYELKLELVRQLHNQKMPVDQIDERVKVDDHIAANALRNLIARYQIQSANLLREQILYEKNQNYWLYIVVVCSVALAVLTCILCGLVMIYTREQLSLQSKISSRQKLLNASPNPILVVAESGEIVVANHGAEKLFECGSEMLVGRAIEDFIPESLRNDHTHYRTLFFNSDGERTMRNPVALTTLNGLLKRVEVQIGLYQLDKDRFAVVNLLDVSKVENIQRHAAEVEQTFRMTFELAPVGIAQISLEGNFIKVNRQFANILGYSRKALEELAIDAITPSEERNSHRMAVNRLIGSDVDHVRLEKRYRDFNGGDVWVIHTLSLYRNELGHPEYLISIFEDISYRKKYEDELLASEVKFKSIANHVQGVVWMATPGIEQIQFVSNRYEELWGRPIQSVKDNPRNFISAILPEDQPKVLAEIENHRKGKWNVDYRILGRDGNIRYIHDEGAPVRDANGNLTFMVGLARDVTEEHVARERLRQTNRQLEQLAKFDPLTMAVRRPYAVSDLDECIALHKRYGTVATLVFIDLNDFKCVNDSYGHEAGDLVLAEFSSCVRENIRETDGFYRYAGDEFLLLLRETGVDEGAAFLRKLKMALATVRLDNFEDVTIAISHGVVTLGEVQIDDANRWINMADERMYLHKKALK